LAGEDGVSQVNSEEMSQNAGAIHSPSRRPPPDDQGPNDERKNHDNDSLAGNDDDMQVDDMGRNRVADKTCNVLMLGILHLHQIQMQPVMTMICKWMLWGLTGMGDGTLNILVLVRQRLLRSTTTQWIGDSLIIEVPLNSMMKISLI